MNHQQSKLDGKSGVIRRLGTAALTAAVILGSFGSAGLTGHAAAAQVSAKAVAETVVLKYNNAITQHEGLYRDGQVWVPVTFLRDAVKLPLSYDSGDKVYTLGSGPTETELRIWDGYRVSVYVNGFFISESEGRLINNRIYLPADIVTDYLGYYGDWSPGTGRLNVVAQKGVNDLAVTKKAADVKLEGANVNIVYPQISGLSNAAAQQKINAVLEKTTLQFAAAAKEEMQKRQADEREYEYQSQYLVTYNQNGVLSLILDQYSYQGGAHGGTFRQGFTFSLKDGKQLQLDDLFGANKNFRTALNNKVGAALKAHGGYLGGFDRIKHEKQFYLKNGKVVLFFQQYEYTAYAAGIPAFAVSFQELLPDGSSPFTPLQ